MKRIINHPWTIAITSTILAGIISELTSLKIISRYFWPMLNGFAEYGNQMITMKVWHLFFIFILSLIMPVLFLIFNNKLKAANKVVRYNNISWSISKKENSKINAICSKCRTILIATTEPEMRTDKLGSLFKYKPNYHNLLICPKCNNKIALQLPYNVMCDEVLKSTL